MPTCYLCKQSLKKRSGEGKGTICPKCGSNYCIVCSYIINNCFICGSQPVIYTLPSSESEPDEQDQRKKDKRKEARRDLTATIEYIYPDNTSDFPKSVTAITVNISESGVCIYTLLPHKKGEKLKLVRSVDLGYKTTAEVRWTKHINDKIYKVGLMFLKEGLNARTGTHL